MNDRPQRSAQAQFGRTADRYRVSRTHSSNDHLVDLAEFAGFTDERFDVAVDIGAGPGFTAFAMAPFARRVIATDITPQMLEQLRALRNERGADGPEMALAAAEALPFADDSVDLIACRTAAHHFVDFTRWLSEVHRVLRPGGTLLAADTCAPEDAALASWMLPLGRVGAAGIEARLDRPGLAPGSHRGRAGPKPRPQYVGVRVARWSRARRTRRGRLGDVHRPPAIPGLG